MRIDAHQHFWALGNPFTDWPTPDLDSIFRDFGPADLLPHLRGGGIDGTVLVQAAPCLDETRYLLSLADRHRFVKGVVGWVDLAAADAAATITELAGHPSFRGVRAMVQDIDEAGWLLRPELTPAFDAIIAHGLCFDALVHAGQLGDIIALTGLHPALKLVLDHGGKPRIAAREFESWAADIHALAAAPNAWCKVSGLWTEAGGNCAPSNIEPYVTTLLEAFGPVRLMWGSDWPVIELAGTYGNWLAQCESLLAGLPDADRKRIFGETAAQFYGIKA